ncbi:MAG: response regulator [Alphaproteobacteria bacterium]|nr:MAG: response regulator [Alphaproteobacteria bacterium]
MAKTTILYIDDNEDNVFMLRSRLCRAGYDVVVAHDGAEGVHLARERMPDVILMDITLPHLDGLSATRQLKNHPRTRDIPVIVLTAHAGAKDRERALESGADDFETVPVRLPRLMAKIEHLVERRATA